MYELHRALGRLRTRSAETVQGTMVQTNPSLILFLFGADASAAVFLPEAALHVMGPQLPVNTQIDPFY